MNSNTRSKWLYWLVAAALIGSLVFAAVRIAPIYLTPPTAAAESESLAVKDWQQAMQDLDEHNSAAARSFLNATMGQTSQQSRRSLLQGRLFLEEGKLFAARQTLAESLADAQLHIEANYWSGAASYAIGDTIAAEQYWLEVLQAAANHTDTHRSLAMIYYDRGAIDHAVQHLNEVARLAPADARPYRLLGLIHKDYERYGEAATFYRQALARELTATTRQQVNIELAEALIKTRSYQDALDTLQTVPASPDIQVLQAECMIGLGNSAPAAELLDQVLKQQPEHFSALSERAGVYLEQQQYDSAIELLQRAIQLKPADYLATFRLAQSLRAAGKTLEAEQAAQRANDIKTKRERFSKLHQDATARPQDAQVRIELGELAADLDMPELSVTWYRAALDLDPQNKEIQQRLQGAISPATTEPAVSEIDLN